MARNQRRARCVLRIIVSVSLVVKSRNVHSTLVVTAVEPSKAPMRGCEQVNMLMSAAPPPANEGGAVDDCYAGYQTECLTSESISVPGIPAAASNK